ncbi:MAG: hypothetical protein Kow00127_12290 [Bacteroidales bacterium]
MKRVLKSAVFYLLFVVLIEGVKAQGVDSSKYYQYVFKKYFAYLKTESASEDKDLKEMPEFKHYIINSLHWGTKQDEEGNMVSFGESLYDYYNETDDIAGEFELEWSYNAPDALWSKLNPYGDDNRNAGQGLIISLWVNKDNVNHILAGGQYCGGLWETIDGGANWYNLTEDYPLIQGISSIWVNPNDTNQIFVTSSYDAEHLSGYSCGLYYTYNGGNDWHLNRCLVIDENNDSSYYYPFGNSKLSPRVFLRNPVDTNIMYLALVNQLLQSTDNGSTWKILLKVPGDDNYFQPWIGKRFFNDMTFDPVDPSILYLCGPKAFRIEDNGENIIEITDSLLAVPGNTDTIAKSIQVDVDVNYPDSVWFTVLHGENSFLIVNYNKITNMYTRYSINEVLSEHWFECDISPTDPNLINVGGGIVHRYNIQTGTKQSLGCCWQGFHNDSRSSESCIDEEGNEILFLGTDGGITKVVNPETAGGIFNILPTMEITASETLTSRVLMFRGMVMIF